MTEAPGAGDHSSQPAVVIMAGGPGERLWPLSRPGRPKPLISVLGETLLHRAYRQALGVTSPEDIYVIAQEADRRAIMAELPDLEVAHFLGEPLRRDTAMAVLLAVAAVARSRPKAIVVLLPADHAVEDEMAFQEAIKRAAAEAFSRQCLCLLGTVPTEPRSEFGYLVGRSTDNLMTVERFVEKPDSDRAKRLIDEGALWNMGIFVGSVDAFRKASKQVAPKLAGIAGAAEAALASGDLGAFRTHYTMAPTASFDRTILENVAAVMAIQCRCGWSDLGNWPEFVRFQGGAEGSERFTLRETGAAPLQVLGLEGVIICNTPAGSLVTTPAAAAAVRPIAQEEPGFIPRLAEVVSKPWGAEYVWARTDRYAAKLLFVRAGEILSLQYHIKKQETMWVISGNGIVEIDGSPIAIGPGDVFTIGPGTLHRVEAYADLSVVEASTPELDDIVRCEDRYGRVPADTVERQSTSGPDVDRQR
ncbi:MAG: sugar phosphate nucleotidyltransferase [Sulfobacillus sp.]